MFEDCNTLIDFVNSLYEIFFCILVNTDTKTLIDTYRKGQVCVKGKNVHSDIPDTIYFIPLKYLYEILYSENVI